MSENMRIVEAYEASTGANSQSECLRTLLMEMKNDHESTSALKRCSCNTNRTPTPAHKISPPWIRAALPRLLHGGKHVQDREGARHGAKGE
jgi:hypothetical protein